MSTTEAPRGYGTTEILKAKFEEDVFFNVFFSKCAVRLKGDVGKGPNDRIQKQMEDRKKSERERGLQEMQKKKKKWRYHKIRLLEMI